MLIYLPVVFIVFLIGILRCRTWAYWKWAIVLAVWTAVWPYLFAGGGTLDDPQGDGLITAVVRIATQDGPQVALFGLAVIVTYWGGIVFFVWRMVQGHRMARASAGSQATHEARLDDDGGVTTEAVSASPGRKGLEVAGLCAVTLGIVYFHYLDFHERLVFEAFKDELAEAVAQSEGTDPVAEVLQDMAAGVNTRLPEKLDAITIYERVTAKGRTLTYVYRITREGIPDNELAGFVQDTKLPKFCRDPRMRHLAEDYDVAVRIGFLRPDRPTPYTVDLDSASCGADRTVERYLQTWAADENVGLPQLVHENTTLERVTAAGRILTYHYRLDRRDISDAEMIWSLRMDDVPRICASAAMRRLIDDRGVTFRHRHLIPDRALPLDVDIDAALCREYDAAADGKAPDPVAQYLDAWAARASTELPERLDETATLERVSAAGRVFVHHYTLVRGDRTDAEEIAHFRQTQVPRICAGPDVRRLYSEHGVTFRYRYLFSDSAAPFIIDIDASTCREVFAAAAAGTGPDPIAQYLQAWAEDADADLPKRVAGPMTLERVSAKDRMIVYLTRARRSARAGRSDEELIAAFRKDRLPVTCAKSKMRGLIDNEGVTFRYRYRFPGRTTRLAINIDADDCREFDAAEAARPAVVQAPPQTPEQPRGQDPGSFAQAPLAEAPAGRDLQAWAAHANRTLPRQIDAATTYERMSVQGRTLVSHYRLNQSSGAGEDATAFSRKTIPPRVCAKARYREWIDRDGITLRFSYRYADSDTPITVDVDAAACAAADAAAAGKGPDPVVLILQKFADRAKAQLPKQMGPVTTLERVSVQGRSFVYHYRVADWQGSPEDALARYRKLNVLDSCGSRPRRELMNDLGVVFRHSYLFAGSDAPRDIDVDAAACAEADGLASDPIARKLQTYAAGVNLLLPKQLDETHTQERVSAQGRTFTFHFGLKRTGRTDEDVTALYRKTTPPQVCARANLREWIDEDGVTVRYSYLFADNDTPLTMEVDAAACRKADAFEEDVQALVAELNADLPEQVDENMTYERVAMEGRRIVYHYSLNRRLGVPKDEFAANIAEIVVPEHCSDRDMRGLMDDDGITFRYSYRFPDRDEPVTVDIDAALCRAAAAAAAKGPEPVADILQEVVAEMNAALPQRLDAVTTLERVTAQGLTVVFHGRLSRRDLSDETARAALAKRMLVKICANPITRDKMEELGLAARVVYRFDDGSAPVTVDVDARICREG